MNASVYVGDQRLVFEDAVSVRTDEHNNLEVLGKSDQPLGLFNRDHWDRALYGEEVDSDGQD